MKQAFWAVRRSIIDMANRFTALKIDDCFVWDFASRSRWSEETEDCSSL
jgi:hypothetical protein